MKSSDILQLLNKLHECKEPFKVIFSGKKRKGINGTYTFASREIVIHDGNFKSDDGLNENSLMYTAMHELAHHIQHTEYKENVTRCHTELFHSILDGLADKAEKLGLYKAYNADDLELEKLVIQAQILTQDIAKLQRELGKVLLKLNNACVKKGFRMEDVVKRKVDISLKTFKKVCNVAQLSLPEGISADVQEAVASERDEDKRRAMAAAAAELKSVAQVKQTGRPCPSGSRNSKDETESLTREKERLEKTIAMLKKRLNDVMARLNSYSGLRSPCAADNIYRDYS